MACCHKVRGDKDEPTDHKADYGAKSPSACLLAIKPPHSNQGGFEIAHKHDSSGCYPEQPVPHATSAAHSWSPGPEPAVASDSYKDQTAQPGPLPAVVEGWVGGDTINTPAHRTRPNSARYVIRPPFQYPRQSRSIGHGWRYRK